MAFLAISICACSDVTNFSGQEVIDWINDDTIAPAGDDHLSEEERSWYLTDAEKLSLRYIDEIDTDKIEIPQELVDLFYNGLIHIVNSDHEKAIKVTREQPIHATQPASPYTIMIMVDTVAASSWLNAWRNGETGTGNLNIDKIIDKYGYVLDNYSELTSMSNSMAIFLTDRLVNGYATGNLLKKVPSIESAGPIPVFYTGFIKDIEVQVFDEYLLYTFVGGNAAFRVFKNGTVEFVE